MNRIPRAALAALLLIGLLAAGSAMASDRGAARRGAGWLLAHSGGDGRGASADAAVALRAAGALDRAVAGRRAATLRAASGAYDRTPGATAKTILGLTALGAHRPQCAGRTNLLARMLSFGHRGRFSGDVFDQALPMLALRALGSRPSTGQLRVLRAMRGRGAWGYQPGMADDPSSTALAVMALRAGGASAHSPSIRAGLSWLAHHRARGGGYAMSGRDHSEANSTALVIEAERALGRHDPRARRALRRLQLRNGSFAFVRGNPGSVLIATNDAVVALAGRSLPVGRRHSVPGGRCS